MPSVEFDVIVDNVTGSLSENVAFSIQKGGTNSNSVQCEEVDGHKIQITPANGAKAGHTAKVTVGLIDKETGKDLTPGAGAKKTINITFKDPDTTTYNNSDRTPNRLVPESLSFGNVSGAKLTGGVVKMSGNTMSSTIAAIINPSGAAGAIKAATGNDCELQFTHVGIAVISSRADSVLEATSDGGVRMTVLSDFLNKSARLNGRPVVVAKRLKDTAGIAAAVARARTFLGQPYDYSFRPDNGKLYCSELVWESYLAPDGRRLFPAQPMNFRAADGSMPPFWNELFAKLGEEIPEGLPGTNPNDMSRDTSLTEVFRWF